VHEQSIGETTEALSERMEGFYESYLDY